MSAIEALIVRLDEYNWLKTVDDLSGEPVALQSEPREIFDAYAKHLVRQRRSPNSIRLRLGYVRRFYRYLSAAGIGILDVTLDEIEDYIFGAPTKTANTQAGIVSSLRSFYGWATRYGRIQVNPSADLVGVRVNQPETRIASDEAINAGLDKATVRERAMLLLGSECGLRVSEIACLNVSNRTGEWLTIIGKGGRKRSVWISPELRDTLDDLERTQTRHGHYFPGRSGAAMSTSTVWRHIRDLIQLNPHSLRHRAGTTVYRNTGNNLRVAQQFLGHASPNTTAIYVHVEREDLKAAGQAARITSSTLGLQTRPTTAIERSF